MSAEPMAVLAAIAVLAATPVALVLLAGTRHVAELRLSPGRFFLGYAVLFSSMLLAARYLAFPAALSILGIALGWLGTARGSAAAARLAFGPDWLAGRPAPGRAGLTRWHLAAWLGAILSITAAIAMAYSAAGGAPAP